MQDILQTLLEAEIGAIVVECCMTLANIQEHFKIGYLGYLIVKLTIQLPGHSYAMSREERLII